MIALPPTTDLQPVRQGDLRLFPSSTTEMLRLDLLFEAGSAYQPVPLCAAAANKLPTLATEHMDAAALSEFMDYRGVIIEIDNDVQQCRQTFYLLRRHADEVLPVVADMVLRPAFTEGDFRTWQARKRQEILAAEQRTSVQARRLFYEALFGPDHPLGRHATADDALSLDLGAVRSHFDRLHRRPTAIILSGATDGLSLTEEFPTTQLITLHSSLITHHSPLNTHHLPLNTKHSPLNTIHLPSAVQTSLRVGRVLDLPWDSPDYAALMIAVTALGGYFGSRLMSNIREDKGYTYGIYARTQIYRGLIVFYITADVAGGTAPAAIDEVRRELRRLCTEPLPADEFDLVRTVLAADFLRSVDGVFERAARHCDMLATCVDERFTDNLRRALAEVTPEDIRRVAAAHLDPDLMTVCTAGAE